jgi:hypothetical protein
MATAFGLDIESEVSLPFLEGSDVAATGRAVSISCAEARRPRWPAGARLICDERQSDGSVVFQIEAADLGFRIHGPAYGVSVLAGDGTSIWGLPGDAGMASWQRLLIAQVLPFAAVVRGIEVLHASAVVLDGEAVALAGRSGSGKTSLALALHRRGAALLADDVLAIERNGDKPLAHPGAPVAGIDQVEAERLRRRGEEEPGEVLAADARERVTRTTLVSKPAAVRAFFLLDRRADFVGSPVFESVEDPRELLSSTFNLVLASPERLAGLLDICALLSRRRVERVSYGTETDATEVAEALLARLARGE